MKPRLILLIPLMLSLTIGWAQTTPKAKLIYCSCAETPYGVPDKGKDYFELIADEGKTPKVVKCTDAGTDFAIKEDYNVTEDDVKQMQQILQDLDVGKLNGYNQHEDMTGGSSFRVYMEYADGSNINATWYTHQPKEQAVTTYNTILRQLSAYFKKGSESKEGQIKRIREVYAEAKEMVAANGKEGKAPQDMTITLNDGTEVDEDFIINEETELTYYFKRKNEPTSYIIDDTSICYFMTESFSAHGHTRYRELLFDPKEGHLLFAYNRSETDAGYVIESRYYFDKTGKIIDQKHNPDDEEVLPELYKMFDGAEELDDAKKYLDVFDVMLNHKDVEWAESNVKTTPKNDRMKMIRRTYSQAKDKVAKNEKSALPRDMHIVIQDQLAEDYPPTTKDMKFYFETKSTDESYNNHCYFISRKSQNMYFYEYAEYLLAPDSHKLIFSYTQAKEEGETYEFRYYFDENGKCIEEKIQCPEEIDEGDMGVEDKQQFTRYMKVFDLLANTTM